MVMHHGQLLLLTLDKEANLGGEFCASVYAMFVVPVPIVIDDTLAYIPTAELSI